MQNSRVIGLLLGILLLASSFSFSHDAFAKVSQVPQRVSTQLTLEDIELKDTRDVFEDFEEVFIFEGEVLEIDGELRTTVESEELKEDGIEFNEEGIGGATIKIVAKNPAGETITLVEVVTDSGGNFDALWKVQIIDPDGSIDLFAVYEGSSTFQPAISEHRQIKVRVAPLEIVGERSVISVGISSDPVILRTGYLSRFDLEFHNPGSTSALDEVWYDFVVVQDAIKIREERNVFAEEGNSTHFFTTRSNNEISVFIYLRGFGEDAEDFEPLNDLARFTIAPLANREVGVVMNADKLEYLFEEIIVVNGKIPAFEPVPLTIQVKNPNGKVCVFENLPTSGIDQLGNFQIKFRLDQKRCEEPGRYKLTAFYGNQKASTSFVINAPSTTIDLIKSKKNTFTMLRVNNAPFADSVYELRLVFLGDTFAEKYRVPLGWFSHFDDARSTLTFSTDYNPIPAASTKFFKIKTPLDTVHVQWFTVDQIGKVTGTGLLTIR